MSALVAPIQWAAKKMAAAMSKKSYGALENVLEFTLRNHYCMVTEGYHHLIPHVTFLGVLGRLWLDRSLDQVSMVNVN